MKIKIALVSIILGGCVFLTIDPKQVNALEGEEYKNKSSELNLQKIEDLNESILEMGYFRNHVIGSTPKRIDPVHRLKMNYKEPVQLNVNVNRNGETLMARAVSPGNPTLSGPWMPITAGTAELVNFIPTGYLVNIEIRTISNFESTYISGSWNPR